MLRRDVSNLGEWVAEFSLKFFEQKFESSSLLPSISESIEIHPHQFKGRLLFAKKNHGGALLIADEVGLGKTYSAGHIIHYMVSQGIAKRVLVLCPARLVTDKWIPTLKQFNIRPMECYNGRSLHRWLSGNFNRNIMVSSYEKASELGVSIDEFEESFAKGEFQDIDLLVIDEIHNFVQDANLRIRLAQLILNISSTRIGLTATPIWNERNDFKEIIQLLQPEGEFTSTLEKEFDIQGSLTKLFFGLMDDSLDSELLNLQYNEVQSLFPHVFDEISASELSDEEKLALRDQITEISPFSTWMTRTTSREVFDNRTRIIGDPILIDLDKSGGKWFNQDTQQMESTRSEYETYDMLQQLLTHSAHKLQFSSMPSAYSFHLDDNLQNMGFRDEDTALIQELSNELKEGTGSKLKAIGNKIQQLANEDYCTGIVIFTQWRPTYKKVEEYLDQLVETNDVNIKIYKGNPTKSHDELKSIRDSFQSHDTSEIPVILVTSIFNEGLDLYRANCMIHLDVPKNPLLLEQRIGRIDRMGQQSDEVYIYYILLNQSTEHEYLEVLKSRLSEYGSYFGAANPILPDDTGWDGKISDEVRDLIRLNDISSMASLSLPNEHLSSFSEEMKEVLNNPLRMTYAPLMHSLFSTLLSTEGVRYDNTVRFQLDTTNGAALNFFNTFGNQDVVLVGEQGDESRPGLLSQLVERGDFLLHLDNSGHPLIPEIKFRTIEMLLQNSPNLPAVRIACGSGNSEAYLVRFTCNIEERSYSKVYAFAKEGSVMRMVSESNWMEWLLSLNVEQSLQLVSDDTQTLISGTLHSELQIHSETWLERRLNDYKSRSTRLGYYIQSVIENDSMHRIERLKVLESEILENMKACRIESSDIEVLAILEGRL